MKFLRQLDLIITLLCAGAIVVALAAPYVEPSKNWLYGFFAIGFPWIFGANVVTLLYWTIRWFLKSAKRWVVFIPLAVLLFGWASPARLYQYHYFAKASESQQVMRVMSFNIHSQKEIKGKKGNFEKFIQAQHPDVLLLQECGNKTAKYLAKLLDCPVSKANGTVVLTKYPIIDYGQSKFYKSGNSYTWADIKVHDEIVRFFSLHLQSTMISVEANELVKSGDIQNTQTWSTIRKILALYRRTAKQRTAQAQTIKRLAAESPYPVFFCGDFNDVPLSHTYHILAENKLDTFIEKGKGMGRTYRGNIPNLRIDCILTPKSFVVLKYETPDVSFSDHYPIVADIAWQL